MIKLLYRRERCACLEWLQLMNKQGAIFLGNLKLNLKRMMIASLWQSKSNQMWLQQITSFKANSKALWPIKYAQLHIIMQCFSLSKHAKVQLGKQGNKIYNSYIQAYLIIIIIIIMNVICIANITNTKKVPITMNMTDKESGQNIQFPR